MPPLRFSYFDPTAGDYVTLTSEPISLHLQQAAEPVPPPVPQPNNQPSPITPKKKVPPFNAEPGQSGQVFRPLYRPLYEQRRFQTVLAGAGCCLAAGLLLDLRRKRLESNPGLALRRQAERDLARDCRAMQAAIAAGDQERFRRHCREAVQRWTGVIWGRAAAAITLTDLRQQLPADSHLLAVFARLEESDYAGAALAQAEMEAILQTVRQELDKLA